MIKKIIKRKNSFSNLLIILFLIYLISLITYSSFYFEVISNKDNIDLHQKKDSDYIFFNETIKIYNDSAFLYYNFIGSGTPTDPYIIENLNISTKDHYGIHIANTSSIFIIRNCIIDAADIAIFIEYTAYNSTTIENNKCINTKNGIKVVFSPYSKILNNFCSNNLRSSIYLAGSSFSTIVNNTCENNKNVGIRVDHSSNISLVNNQIQNNNENGVFLYFITNSEITSNNISSNSKNGIKIYYSNFVIITKNFIKNNGYNGITGEFLYKSTIENNIVSYNTLDGIKLSGCNDTKIINNTVSMNFDDGIDLLFSPSSIFDDNLLIQNNREGIKFLYSPFSEIKNNTFSKNGNNGLFLKYSSFSDIVNNNFSNNGLFLLEKLVKNYETYNISKNLVNGKPLGFFVDLNNSDFLLNKYGQLIFVNCNNISIANQIISHTSAGIALIFCSDIIIMNTSSNFNYQGFYAFQVENLQIHNSSGSYNRKNGIYLTNVNTTLVSLNTINNNSDAGIKINSCSNVNLQSNIIFDNYDGILSEFVFKIHIENNYCNNNQRDGIHLLNSPSAIIHNNTCYNNMLRGIYLYINPSFEEESNDIIRSNTIYQNNDGIYVQDSDGTYILNNILYKNSRYGVVLVKKAQNNQVVNNIFWGNNLFAGTSQAFAEQSLNLFYDLYNSEGNYWSDYSGSGYYSIDGNKFLFDIYPLNLTKLTDSDNDSMPNWWEEIHNLKKNYNDAFNDSDADGLSNLEEFQYYSEPNNQDSDGDGLYDGDEVKLYNTNPALSDSDKDGLPDKWELDTGTNPNVNDAKLDLDSDGLSNILEYELNTLANNSDTDSDGMEDGWEYENELDPLFNDSSLDPDNDTLSNLEEYYYGTDPKNPDTDGDGQLDGSEVNSGFDPLNPESNLESYINKKKMDLIWIIVRIIVAIFLITIIFIYIKKRYFKKNVINY